MQNKFYRFRFTGCDCYSLKTFQFLYRPGYTRRHGTHIQLNYFIARTGPVLVTSIKTFRLSSVEISVSLGQRFLYSKVV
jgi:hypothetical protein